MKRKDRASLFVFIGRIVKNTGDGFLAEFPSVYARDIYGQGSVLSSEVDTIATQPGLLIRDGLDLDELDGELRGYKVILGIYPQGRLDPAAQPLIFTVGVTDYPNVNPVFGPPQT
jgi:hypothetical protein